MDGGAVNLTTFQTGQRPVRNNLHQLVTAVQLATGVIDTCNDLHKGLVRTCRGLSLSFFLMKCLGRPTA